jgi:hypothetical protein
MPKYLDDKKKKSMLYIYMDLLIQFQENSDFEENYERVKKQLLQAKIYSFELKKKSSGNSISDIQSQLMSFIYKNFDRYKRSYNFHELLINGVYKKLNKKYQFDTELGNKHRQPMAKALQAIISHWYDFEVKNAKKRALIDSLLMSCFIVTIPFAYSFYKMQLDSYKRRGLFTRHFKENIELKFNEKYKNQYGTIQKSLLNQEGKDFKKILFKTNEQNHFVTRKFLLSDTPENGREGLTFLATASNSSIYRDKSFSSKELSKNKHFSKIKKTTKLNPEICDLISEYLDDTIELIVDPKKQKRLGKERKNKILIEEIEEKIDQIECMKKWRTGKSFGFYGRNEPNTISYIKRHIWRCKSGWGASYSETLCKIQIELEKTLANPSLTRFKSTTTFYKEILTLIENAESKIEKNIRLGLDQNGNPLKINSNITGP